MRVFVCAACEQPLTAPLSRVAFPWHALTQWGHQLLRGQLLEPKTYVVDPGRDGPRWRRWQDETPEPPGAPLPRREDAGGVGICLGDIRGTVFLPDRLDGYCCGLMDVMACESCGVPVARLIDDCGHWQVVWLDPGAVRATGTDDAALPWDEIGDAFDRDPSEIHDAEWSVMAGRVTARLLAASGGVRLAMPAGTEILGDVLDLLLPAGPGGRTVALAGPGRPATPGADVALVPEHPQTEEIWRGDVATPIAVPWAVWRCLAFPADARRLLIAGPSIPRAALLDDPTLMSRFHVTPDLTAFITTLATSPEVREPWLRAVYDRYADKWRPSWPFW
ncbi:hypothetical protein FDA94_36615 [Herbidospora galbida]|uniref:Uncharacterized protein n=1 Tax=Herbidospora galbida TaxID=2575442 RepID=A0A4U3LSE9_9ACTN|nr:hypothetical protein [Herbidospora galbida]TKK78915.1 hypothetical protein FDA94_36615 [Herbidospora galbida]